MGVDKLFPIFVAAVCVVLLIRMALGDKRRTKLDKAFIKAWAGLSRRVKFLYQWRSRRQSAAQARQVAQDVIQRVRHRVEKEGNVLTPEAFKEPRKPH
jgi:hypothetical protein